MRAVILAPALLFREHAGAAVADLVNHRLSQRELGWRLVPVN